MRSSVVQQMDRDMSSSPDPLASSTTCDNTKASMSTHAKKASSQKNSTVRKSVENVPTLLTSSPSRIVAEQTLSPWKIRVTVETEPESQIDGPVETVTRTIQIPLRGGSSPAHENTKQTKGRQSQPRSRSKQGASSKERQRSVTPTTERRRRQSVTDLDIVVLGDDADEDEWGKKQKKSSPRKSRTRKSTTKSNSEDTTAKPGPQFDVRQDTDVEEDLTSPREDTPELRQIDLNRVSIRPRSNSTKQKVQFSDDAEANVEDDRGGVRDIKSMPAVAITGRRTVSANSALTYPTPSPTASERGRSVEIEEVRDHVRDHVEGFDTIMESEGFTMIDLDTLPSVKQMLSSPADGQTSNTYVPSLSPAQSDSTVRRSGPEVSTRDNEYRPSPAKAISPHLILPEGESEISSTVPSSPPIFQARPNFMKQKSPLASLQVPAQSQSRKVTPQTYSSPKLPSPPRQPMLKERSTPDSAKAMRAGLALQSAVEPVTGRIIQQRVTPGEIDHARSSSEELFEGFDSGTKRELRAGLRFGEELAKRQPKALSAFDSDVRPAAPVQSQVWRGQSVMSRTPVQIEPRGLSTTDKSSTQNLYNRVSSNLTPATSFSHVSQHLDTEARREHQWDLERQAVVKQIQEASPSKVVVIDSDDDRGEFSPRAEGTSAHDVTMDMDGDDIWLEEAKDSSSPSQGHSSSDPSVGSDESRQPEIERAVFEKPRRNLIPSPWRRGEQLEQGNNTTILTSADDVSGMLWNQAAHDEVLFGAAAINNVRKELRGSGVTGFPVRRMSGSFNIDKMLGTPKRIRESIDREHNVHAKASHPQRSSSTHDRRGDDFVEEEESVDDSSQFSEVSDGTSSSSQQQLQSVPDESDDSTSSAQRTPQQSRSRTVLSPSAVRPPTPRSAMKGARQSFGAVNGLEHDEEDYASRRVIFAQRSKGVNVDWVESSSSVRSSAEDFSSPTVEHQRHHEERQSVHAALPETAHEPEQDGDVDEEERPNQLMTVTSNEKGWFGWLRKNKQQKPDDLAPSTQVDGTEENPADQSHQQKPSARDETLKQSAQEPKTQIPPYLLPPSYPSDPTRSPTTPLPPTGKFTNHHFRTLHILHRRSQRPRFHAPKFSSCRPEIRELALKKWRLEVDESEAGLGGFAWTVGETEARVLERFCREVEFGVLRARVGGDGGEGGGVLQRMVAEWLGSQGIWGGKVGHATGPVLWEWDMEMLANWLGRIVVGEVVRVEEFGGSGFKA